MYAHKMTSLYYLLCHMQSADQCTVDDKSIIALAFDHCVGSMAKTINFHGYGTSQVQRGGLTDPFHGGP